MLEYSVKSLYVNRRYLLVVMGMVYLGLIIALYSFLSCAIGILADAAGSVSEAIVSEVEAFAGEFTVARISDVPELWEKILVILGDKASAASKEIVETLVVMIISIVLSVQAAKALTVAYIKDESANRVSGPLPTLLCAAVRMVADTALAAGFIWLLFIRPVSAFAFIIVYLFVSTLVNLLLVKLTSPLKLSMKKIFTVKNISGQFCYYLAIAIVCCALVFVVFTAFSVFVAVLVAAPLIIYCAAVMESASYGYITDRENRTPKPLYRSVSVSR